jgi:hypothetical protein
MEAGGGVMVVVVIVRRVGGGRDGARCNGRGHQGLGRKRGEIGGAKASSTASLGGLGERGRTGSSCFGDQ